MGVLDVRRESRRPIVVFTCGVEAEGVEAGGCFAGRTLSRRMDCSVGIQERRRAEGHRVPKIFAIGTDSSQLIDMENIGDDDSVGGRRDGRISGST